MLDKFLTRLGMLAVMFLAAQSAFAGLPDCSRSGGSLPLVSVAPGTINNSIPVEHILVIMEENHSFDNFLGHLSSTSHVNQVDGLTDDLFNLNASGREIHPFHQSSHHVRNTEHSWDGSHLEWNFGANDGFVTQNGIKDGSRAMGYYDASDLPLLYSLADRFAIGDRFFSSVMGPTWPNRYYYYAATSRGVIRNEHWISKQTPTIYTQLSRYGISWKYYSADIPLLGVLMPHMLLDSELRRHFATTHAYRRDLENGKLPQVVFLESSVILGDEHPPFDFRFGQREVGSRIRELIHSPYWEKSALFITYDEHGGYFDHVSPPQACAPDEIAPRLGKDDHNPSGFDRYGFRVPFLLVSPFAKRHYVSHVTFDHTSILKFIETKFNLPALTRRDANADAMLDLFDFEHPDTDYQVPQL